MARSDAAWVDVLPQMKGFATPLIKNVKEASKKAGQEGGRALADGMNAEAKKTDVSPVVKQLEQVESAARKAADEQAKAAKRAASEVGKSQTRIIDARDKERTAAAQLEKAEADLERRRTTATQKADQIEQAERVLQEKRDRGEASTEDLSKAEQDLASKRAAAAQADADVSLAAAKLETARNKQAQATEKVENEETALRAAIHESRSAHEEARAAAADHARAQEDLAREVGESAREADRALPAWKRLWSGMDGTKGLKGRIVAGMKGIGNEIEKEAGRIRGRGDALLGGIGKGVKWGVAGAGAAGLGLLGAAGVGGFKRLADIEDARASLTGLGKDAQTVDQIMDSALQSVKGTAFGMGDAASVAATMTAAGIKPGEDLTKTLSLVADSATIAKRDIGDMGLIWSSVASKGKLQGDDAMQLLESGIPIWQMIGDVMGVTSAEAQELGSKGQVSFETFRTAMEKNLGGAALESGKTVRGSFANLKAAVSRLGASALEGFYPLIAPALKGVTDFIDGIGEKAAPAIEAFSTGAKGLYDIIVKGDFTGPIFGLEEDHWLIGFLFDARDAAIGLYDLLIKGDFTGGIFGLEEDSPIIGMLFSLRDAAIGVGTWIQDNLLPILSGLGGFLAYLGGTAIIGAIGSLGAAIGTAIGAIGWIPLAIGTAVGAITWFFTETETGQDLFKRVWSGIQSAVAGVATWFVETAWPAILTGWDTLKAVAAEVIPVVISYAKTLGDYWSQIVMGVVVPALQQFAGYLQDTVFPIVQRLWTDYVQPAFSAIGAFIAWAWDSVIKPALGALFTFVTETLAPTIVWLWQNIVSPAFSAIGSFIAWAWNSVIFPALDAFKSFLVNVLAPTAMWLWKNVITPVWAGISWAIDTAWAVIQVIFAAIKSFIDNTLAPVFTWLWKQVIVPAWDGIKSAIDTTWTWLKDNVFTPLKNFIQDKVAPGFEAGVDAIGGAWDRLRSIAMSPVRFVIDSVINKGIIDNFNKIAETFGTDKIKHLPVPGMPSTSTAGGRTKASGVRGATMAMATGGVLPGYTPGIDVHSFYSPTLGRLDLSGGEAIMRPEWTRAVGGPAAVEEMNRRARHGMAFKDGGVLGSLWGKAKSVAGDALDTLLDGWDFVTEAVSDPGGALKKVAQTMLKGMPGSGAFKELVTGVPTKIASVIGEKLSGLGGVLGGGPIPAGGKGGSLAAAEALAVAMGLSITSRGRRGARTAGSGLVSLHALGRAIDVAAPMTTAGKALMMSFFNAADARWSPTELLYSPAGARNKHRSGRRAPNTGATLRNHYNHVHIGFAEGGVFGDHRSWPAIQQYAGGGVLQPVKPLVYDQGGWLKPGTSLVHNASGVPEPVFTGRQGKTIVQMLERGVQGPSIFMPITATQLSEADVDRLADEMMRRLTMQLVDAAGGTVE